MTAALGLDHFRATAPARACATPAGAYANCLAASASYAQWLRERDVPAGLLALRGSRPPLPGSAGRWPRCDPRDHAHWTTVAAGWSVDWTARQFDPHADWPRLERVGALTSEWDHVEIWACERCPHLLADPRHGELAPAGLHADHARRAGATGGAGPFPDPRHDDTPALASPCTCATVPRSVPAQP